MGTAFILHSPQKWDFPSEVPSSTVKFSPEEGWVGKYHISFLTTDIIEVYPQVTASMSGDGQRARLILSPERLVSKYTDNRDQGTHWLVQILQHEFKLIRSEASPVFTNLILQQSSNHTNLHSVSRHFLSRVTSIPILRFRGWLLLRKSRPRLSPGPPLASQRIRSSPCMRLWRKLISYRARSPFRWVCTWVQNTVVCPDWALDDTSNSHWNLI